MLKQIQANKHLFHGTMNAIAHFFDAQKYEFTENVFFATRNDKGSFPGRFH